MASRTNFVFSFLIYIFLSLHKVVCNELTNKIDEDVVTTKAYVFWPNATIPFYIDSDHFDNEQSVKIMTAFATFAFKTCLKFVPVMARPEGSDHVLLLENPSGVRKCTINTEPHSIEEPHRVTLGYDCLKSPEIDMMIMKALGFPFEHNRAVRDLYIEVQPENVEPGYIELFSRDLRLPLELRSISYDRNSVLHFGQREFSKNGHRTIIFKDRDFRQERFGLSPLDLRKIEVVYGPECRARDRMEKIELCQNYPGVARRKRDTSDPPEPVKSLRVNPDITPPPNVSEISPVTEIASVMEQQSAIAYIGELEKKHGIEKEIEATIDNFNKITAVALENAKRQKCGNQTKESLRTSESPRPRVLDVIGNVLVYVDDLVKTATQNLTEFCMEETDVARYQRSSCPFFDPDRCPRHYKSTMNGRVRHSTQHRPFVRQSTKVRHPRITRKPSSEYRRSKKDSVEGSNMSTRGERRRKRDTQAEVMVDEEKSGYVKRRFESQRFRPNKEVYERRQHEKQWDNSGFSAEKGYHNRNDQSQKVRQIKREETDTNKMSHRFRDDDDIDEDRRDEQEFNEEKRQRDRNQAQAGNRQRHDNKPKYEAMEPRFLPKDLNNDMDKPDKDKKTRFQVRHGKKRISANEESINDGKGARDYDEHRPKLTQKKPANNKQDNDIATEKNRFQIHKPPHNEPIAEDKNSEIEEADKRNNDDDNDNQNQNQKHGGKINREKKKTIAENQHGDGEHYGAADAEDEKKRGRYSGEDASKDVERPSPKKKNRQKESKQRPKTSHKKQPSHNREEKQTRGLPKVLKLDKKNREFYDERMWPDGVVRYVIKAPEGVDVDDVRVRLNEVNRILKKKTCARLEEITEEETERYEDFLVLDNSPDYVTGRVGGKQPFGVVELLKGGQHRQHAAMMVMAMLGFYFEVSRHDRDKFIRVHMRHVRPDKLHHFEKIREDATFPLPYDYKSATHPAWQFWRQIGKSGISTVATLKSTDPDGLVMKSLGQNRQLLSDLDILKINSVYGIDCFISLHGERQGKEREEGHEEEEAVRERENERVEKEEEPRGEKEEEARREKEEQPRGENEEEARGEEDKEEKRVRGNPEEEDVASDEGE